jgi:alpha-D-xyloside xylohydrolase
MESFPRRLNQPPDPRTDFLDPDSFVFCAQKLAGFEPATGRGVLGYRRYRRKPRVAFNHMTLPLEPVEAWEFPANYPEPKALPFELSFLDAGSVRIRFRSRAGEFGPGTSVMLSPQWEGGLPSSNAWVHQTSGSGHVYKSEAGSVVLELEPWSLQVRDATGRELLRTHTLADGRCMIDGRPVPFSFCRRASDLAQTFAASFRLAPGERLYGCGESFTRLDKRGQSVFLCTQDAHGSQTGEMYKPIPFYLSNRGYGVFVHGSTPMVFDLGDSYGDTQVLYGGDDSLDLFVFLGDPKTVLDRYTRLTGRSPTPPLWSFGLWMSRITYSSEEETREVANKLRSHRIPSDVIHLDTGWFEKDWCCNYEFSESRFLDPKKMLADLLDQGFHVSLWQLPYFAPNNPLYQEILEQRLAVTGPGGELPSEDAVIDFSNPATVKWYQGKLARLLEQGVGAIKADFAEAAPQNGLYHSGRTGEHEHNLYPLRYNQAASEVTLRVHGYSLIWARSAWAGSQRYPLHWGGDAEASNGGMLGSLYGGLSLGLSGFSFWSHDVGGFFPATPRDLYLRWLPFGLLISHARCHGLPPTEPWEFDEPFLQSFRRTVELRYRLMPYIWAQALSCSEHGHPLVRPLFFEFPQDPGSWPIEDQYLFGSDLLVAPLFEEAAERDVYLPPCQWVDLQTKERFEGGRFVRMRPGDIPALVLARAGAAIATTAVAQHTGAQDFAKITLLVVGDEKRHEGVYAAKDATTARRVVLEDGVTAQIPGVELTVERI